MAHVPAGDVKGNGPQGRYCVIIPAFNAAKTIGPLVRQIKPLGLNPVVIDDGSRDNTSAVASAEGALVISHLRNQGKGTALRTGFQYAMRSAFDGVVTMDGDGQHDPQEISSLVRAGEVQHAGIVLGNRLTNGTVMPRSRRVTNELMSSIVSAIIHQAIPDSQCGFRFIRKEVLIAVPLRAQRFDLETELILGAAAQRWKIVSVPVRSIYPDAHHSHIDPLWDGLRFLGLIARHLVRRRPRA